MNFAQRLATFVFSSPRSNGKSSDAHRTHLPPNEANNNRCQFTFSDGRQCRNQHAQLCVHHSSTQRREDRGNGFPDEGLVGLVALCGDLTTATNINRALNQVFVLMAQGRIQQKQAVAFGYLTQLLLQTVPGIRSEFVSAHGYQAWQNNLTKIIPLPHAPAAQAEPPDQTPSPSGGETDGTNVVILSSGERLPSSAKRLPTGCAFRGKQSRAFAGQQSQPEQSAQFASGSVLREISPNPISEMVQQPASSVESVKAKPPAPPSPDYTSIFHRSLDLLDHKFDTTPEGLREAKALMTELEQINRALPKARKAAPRSRPIPPPSPEPAFCSSGRPTEACVSGQGGRPGAFSFSKRPPEPPAEVSHASELAVHKPDRCSSGRGAAQPALRVLDEPATAPPIAASPVLKPKPKSRRNAGATPTPTNRTAHNADWYAPASWSGPRPDPYPSRREKQKRKLRAMSDRRLQHQMQSRAFWR